MSTELEKQKRLTQEERAMIIVELASGRFSQKEIASRHELSEQRISQIKLEHADLFNNIREARLESITADQIKQQEYRMEQYARDLEKMDGMWHPEYVKARSQILKNVSDELGQTAPKTLNVVVPVQHQLIGVDVDEDL